MQLLLTATTLAMLLLLLAATILTTILQVKKLIVLNPGDARCIRSLTLRVPEVVGPQHSLLHLLNTFQLGRTHLAMVSHSPKVLLCA
jgi:CBS domain containing-hemolysin-like protein